MFCKPQQLPNRKQTAHKQDLWHNIISLFLFKTDQPCFEKAAACTEKPAFIIRAEKSDTWFASLHSTDLWLRERGLFLCYFQVRQRPAHVLSDNTSVNILSVCCNAATIKEITQSNTDRAVENPGRFPSLQFFSRTLQLSVICCSPDSLLLTSDTVGRETLSDKAPCWTNKAISWPALSSGSWSPNTPCRHRQRKGYLEGSPWAGRSRRSPGRRCTGSELCCRPARCTALWGRKEKKHETCCNELPTQSWAVVSLL